MSYNKCKDCKSECPIDAECITCYNYSNFEPKEKKMKVAINVKEDEFSKDYYRFQAILIRKLDCEIIPDNPKLTIEHVKRILRYADLDDAMLGLALGALMKDGYVEANPKTAREELEELYKDIKDNHEFGYKSTAIENVDKIFNLAIKAIEEAKK